MTTPDSEQLTIDLSCDAGEASSPEEHAIERALLELVTSVNIACGGHTGDEHSMRFAVEIAAERACAIGAHPSYPDREGFGRRHYPMKPTDLEAALREQIEALINIAAHSDTTVTHIKPHGMLYHDASHDPRIAEAVANAALACSNDLRLIGPAHAPCLRIWQSMGIRCITEGFVDRVYDRNGMLRSRSMPDALITDPAEAAQQALRIATEQSVLLTDGTPLPLRADTLCFHSDTPGALTIARQVSEMLLARGIVLRSPCASED